MSDADKQNPAYFPKFLQVLRATEGKEEVWAGLSGKMVSEIMKVEDKMKENHEAMNAEVASVKSDVASMKSSQDKMAAEMAAEVAELKAMMTQLLEQTR
jgi:mannose/fructose-specific phosphotransferase system component IIA